MLYVLYGDEAKKKAFLNSFKNKQQRYVENIADELKYSSKLFSITTQLIYFFYNKETFPESCVEKMNNAKTIYVCLAGEKPDKRSSFYKMTKNYTKEFKIKEFSPDSILKDLSLVYSIPDNDFVSILYKLYYSMKFKHQYSNQKIIGRIINEILTGRLYVETAKKYFILSIDK